MSLPGKFGILPALYSLPKISGKIKGFSKNIFEKFDTPEMKAERESYELDMKNWRELCEQSKSPMVPYIAKKYGIILPENWYSDGNLYNAKPSPVGKPSGTGFAKVVIFGGTAAIVIAGIAYVVSANPFHSAAKIGEDGNNVSQYIPPSGNILPVGSDNDCLSDNQEAAWGHTPEESDLRLRFHIQDDSHDATVKDALTNLVVAYHEKNPNHINVHLFEGNKIPNNSTFDNGQIKQIMDENKKDALGYYYDIYFLEKKGNSSLGDENSINAATADGFVDKDNNAVVYTTDSRNNFIPEDFMSYNAEHEFGHTLGMKNSLIKTDIISHARDAPWTQKTEFADAKWKDAKPYCQN